MNCGKIAASFYSIVNEEANKHLGTFDTFDYTPH